MGDFLNSWEIFLTMGNFFYIPWEISLAKRNQGVKLKERLFIAGDFIYQGRFYLPGEILFAMGDKIYPWMFNLGRYISLFHNHVVSLWLVVYLGRMI